MTEVGASTGTGARLYFSGNALPLFGRYVFAFLASTLVVPAPWMAAWFSKWFVDQTEVKDGTKLSFEGTGGEIWLPVVLVILLGWFSNLPWPEVDPPLLAMRPLLLIPINILLYLLIFRWFVASVRFNGSRQVSFIGSYWPYLGYYLLYVVSMVSIIGWAWVMAAWAHWHCRNLVGDAAFSFHAKGHEILWRCVVCMVGCILVIPIPWMIAWLTKWFTSQVSMDDETRAQAETLETFQIEQPGHGAPSAEKIPRHSPKQRRNTI